MSTQDNNEVYGGFFVRLAAYLVDTTVAGILALMVASPIFMLTSSNPDSFFSGTVLFHRTIADVVMYMIIVLYFTLTTYFTHTTLGKFIFKLRVINVNKEWSFINILYRESIGRFLSSLLAIGYIVLAVDREKRGFHDMLSDTRVVYTVKMVERKIIKQVVQTVNQDGRPVVKVQQAINSQVQPVNPQQSVTQQSVIQQAPPVTAQQVIQPVSPVIQPAPTVNVESENSENL